MVLAPLQVLPSMQQSDLLMTEYKEHCLLRVLLMEVGMIVKH